MDQGFDIRVLQGLNSSRIRFPIDDEGFRAQCLRFKLGVGLGCLQP